jgi:branched-chain amino acid aminotransferase
MSEPVSASASAGVSAVLPTAQPRQKWEVRRATPADAPGVAAAVRELLLELDGTPSAPPAMEAAASMLIVSPWAGAVLVAEVDGELVGVLAASWQMAIHVPGSYVLIQDLWVHPQWRSRSVGKDLLAALLALAHAKRFQRVEVGLPRESFARFASTEAFYSDNGFTANGPRMRRILS